MSYSKSGSRFAFSFCFLAALGQHKKSLNHLKSSHLYFLLNSNSFSSMPSWHSRLTKIKRLEMHLEFVLTS